MSLARQYLNACYTACDRASAGGFGSFQNDRLRRVVDKVEVARLFAGDETGP